MIKFLDPHEVFKSNGYLLRALVLIAGGALTALATAILLMDFISWNHPNGIPIRMLIVGVVLSVISLAQYDPEASPPSAEQDPEQEPVRGSEEHRQQLEEKWLHAIARVNRLHGWEPIWGDEANLKRCVSNLTHLGEVRSTIEGQEQSRTKEHYFSPEPEVWEMLGDEFSDQDIAFIYTGNL